MSGSDRSPRRGSGRRPGGFTHSQRGGRGGRRGRHPQRPTFREERDAARAKAPEIDPDVDIEDLDPMVRQDLKVLSKPNAEAVAKHLVMAASYMHEDPQLGLAHARAAKDRAGRVGVVRETAGIAAYLAGEWKESLSELRAARRMLGGPGLLAVMADCERALKRPGKAVEIYEREDLSGLDPESWGELGVVVAGAHLDLGDKESALRVIDETQPRARGGGFAEAKLAYLCGDLLASLGRTEEARAQFENAAQLDDAGELGSRNRIKQLSREAGETD